MLLMGVFRDKLTPELPHKFPQGVLDRHYRTRSMKQMPLECRLKKNLHVFLLFYRSRHHTDWHRCPVLFLKEFNLIRIG